MSIPNDLFLTWLYLQKFRPNYASYSLVRVDTNKNKRLVKTPYVSS